MAESYKLTYFNIKAVAEPIRFLFAYGQVEYVDNRIEHEQWPELKATTPWGQVPVLEVGSERIGQSNAICRYLARKFNLMGSNDWENAKIDEYADVISDFRSAFGRANKETDEKRKAELMATVKELTGLYFGKMDAAISKNGGSPYLVGKKLTWVDLLVGHYVDLFNVFAPGSMDQFANLTKLRDVVFAIPQIKTWVEKRPKTER